MSSTVLALVIALISVLQSALPVFVNLAMGNRSEAEFALLNVEGETVFIIGANEGNRAAYVSYAVLEIEEVGLNVVLRKTKNYDVLLPGELTPISYNMDHQFDHQIIDHIGDLYPEDWQNLNKPGMLSQLPVLDAKIQLKVIQTGQPNETPSFQVKLQCNKEECFLKAK